MLSRVDSQVTDEELMRRIQDDDRVAFEILYDRLAPKALRVALGILDANSGRAQDAVQASFLSMWRSRDCYRPEAGQVQAWTMGIVRNRAIDSLRSNGRHDDHRSSVEHHLELQRAPDDVESDVVRNAASHELKSLLARLPLQQREVIVLAYYGQLSHTEIAQQLALPVGTVKGRMRLGLTKLREHLL